MTEWFFLLLLNPPGRYHILCDVAIPCLPSQEAEPSCIPFYLFNKNPGGLNINNHPQERRSAGRLKIIVPINHPRALERRLAPCPPQSRAVMMIRRDINVGQRGSFQCQQGDIWGIVACLNFSNDSIILSRWAPGWTGYRRWCITAVWNRNLPGWIIAPNRLINSL